jgi:CheY-like chemotaxis protein
MPGKILIVEDDAINRRFFTSLLAAGGYEVLEAVDGISAIELIARESPSLVLMDIGLPRMNGHDALKACREKKLLGRTKVYALTASGEAEVGEAGFDGIITKPVRVKEFLKAVRDILDVCGDEGEARRN